MPSYLYLHGTQEHSSRKKFLGQYELVNAEYAFRRTINGKGEITSPIEGGEIQVSIAGLGDGTLLRWLFRSSNLEDGEMVTTDGETVTGKLIFSRARVMHYHLHFDSNSLSGAVTHLKIEAGEISTDNDFYFERK